MEFLATRGVRPDLVSAVETQRLTGQALYDKEALLCSYTQEKKVSRLMSGCECCAHRLPDWG